LRIARHGYEVADATLTAHCPELAPEYLPWEFPKCGTIASRAAKKGGTRVFF
jgi:hypothetical protein